MSNPRLRPFVAAAFFTVLTILATVGSVLADGGGTSFPH